MRESKILNHVRREIYYGSEHVALIETENLIIRKSITPVLQGLLKKVTYGMA